MERLEASIFDELEKEQPPFTPATTGERFVNYLIDIVLYYLIYQGVTLLFWSSAYMYASFIYRFFPSLTQSYVGLWIASYLMSCIPHVIYFTILEGAAGGRSFGKYATRTVAVSEGDLSRLTWRQALLRSCVRIVPFEAFSALFGRPWHDKWTGTRVIKVFS